MEEQTFEFSDFVGALKRRRKAVLAIAGSLFLIGALAALLWPPTYKSSATILIKEQDIPPDLVRSTVTSYAAQRIEAIRQRVLARPNLLEIIKKYDLYASDRKRLTTEEIIEEMRDNIDLSLIDAEVMDPRSGRPTSAVIAFQLSFSGEYPNKVQKVANELMSLFLEENLKERSAKARETFQFLTEETDRLQNEIRKYQEELAEFKEAHVNTLPELTQLNMQLMDRTEREISDIDGLIRSKQESIIYLKGQLAQLDPYGSDINLNPATRLQALRTEYAGLVARYSPDHPDVLRMKREIEALEKETGVRETAAERLAQIEALEQQLAGLRERYSDQHPDVVKLKKQIEVLKTTPVEEPSGLATAAADNPDNPAYIQLMSQLQAAESEIASLKAKKAELKNKLTDYEKRLVETPQVEREYTELQRNLQNAIAKYQEIRAKQMEAQIAQALEEERKGERFEIVEPPILPEEPISPNRPAILFLSFVLSLGTGIGYAAVSESLDSSVRGARGVEMASGAPPLGIIPYLESEREKSRRRGHRVKLAAAVVIGFVLTATLLHNFWMPLDVLWYKALRKADVVINT